MVDIEFSTGSGTGLIDRLVCSNTRCTRPALYTFHVLYTYILSTWPPTNQPPDQYQLLQRSISPATDCQLCGAPSNGTSYRVGHRGTFLPANKPCIMALKRGEILKARPPTPKRPSFSPSPFWQARRLLSRNNFGTRKVTSSQSYWLRTGGNGGVKR